MKATNVIYAYLTDRFVKSFFNSVKKSIGPGRRMEFQRKVNDLFARTYERHREMIVDKPAELNLRAVVMVWSAYSTLQESGIGEKLAFHIVRTALVSRQKKTIRFLYGLLKFLRIDMFKFISGISKSKQISAYGKGFVHEILADDRTAFRFVVKKCFYHSFFVKVGAPQLTAIFCDYDNAWGDLLNLGGTNVRFSRPQTIGWGGNCCEFNFERLSS